MSKREAEQLKKGDLVLVDGKFYEFQYFGGYNMLLKQVETKYGIWKGWREVDLPTDLIKALG